MLGRASFITLTLLRHTIEKKLPFCVLGLKNQSNDDTTALIMAFLNTNLNVRSERKKSGSIIMVHFTSYKTRRFVLRSTGIENNWTVITRNLSFENGDSSRSKLCCVFSIILFDSIQIWNIPLRCGYFRRKSVHQFVNYGRKENDSLFRLIR